MRVRVCQRGGGGGRLSLGAISCYRQQSWGRTDSVLTIPVQPVLTESVPTELGAHTKSVTALVPLTTNSSAALLCAHTGPRPDYCVLTTALVTT